MSALATLDDVIELGADPSNVTEAMLNQASARFRSEAGGNQIEVTLYQRVMTPVGGFIQLPHAPVVSISAVKILNDDGTPGTTVTGWVFDGKRQIDVTGLGSDVWLNGPSWNDCDEGRNIWVEWTAGHDPIPEDVRWTVAQMVARAADAGPAGVTSEQIGDFSRSFGAFTASGAGSMTKEERAVAHRYRAKRNTLDVRLG